MAGRWSQRGHSDPWSLYVHIRILFVHLKVILITNCNCLMAAIAMVTLSVSLQMIIRQRTIGATQTIGAAALVLLKPFILKAL
jgi:hypothetical protein